MSKIAVDIALLPPEEIVDLAISANKSVTDPRCVFRLGKEEVLPHITLVQGVMDSEKQGDMGNILRNIAEQETSLDLRLSGTSRGVSKDGYPGVVFSITPTEELSRLHQVAIQKLEGLLTNDATEEMFFNPPIRIHSVQWVRDFQEKHSLQNFDPHITISVGGEPKVEQKFPIPFTASRLAICHLGNGNTCRKILAEFTLTTSK